MTKQISPDLEFEQKIEFPGVADLDHTHTYELRYDHLVHTASLWIDGHLMASGYHGHHQFQENRASFLGPPPINTVASASEYFARYGLKQIDRLTRSPNILSPLARVTESSFRLLQIYSFHLRSECSRCSHRFSRPRESDWKHQLSGIGSCALINGLP